MIINKCEQFSHSPNKKIQKNYLRESDPTYFLLRLSSCAQKRVARIPIVRKQLCGLLAFSGYTLDHALKFFRTSLYAITLNRKKIAAASRLPAGDLLLKRKQRRISAHHNR